MNDAEPEILLKVHAYLKREGLCGRRVNALYTDAHHSLTKLKQLEPFQRVSINHGEFVVHPDMVGTLADSDWLFAVEAKGAGGDLIKGLAQAQSYQDGVHAAFVCAPTSEIGKGIMTLARRYNVGLIAISDVVEVLSEPEIRSPLYSIHESVQLQIETAGLVSSSQTFPYNLPTHYLVWSVLLVPDRWYQPEEVPLALRSYPMPKDWRAALRGAQKLGLIEISAERFRLTAVGATLRDVFPSDINCWKSIHEALCAKSGKKTLKSSAPVIAGVLRLLLLNDPMVKMIRRGIESLPEQRGNFRDLAMACDRLDHARAVIFFFNPEALETIVDNHGLIIWDIVQGKYFRSTMFYQFKSILKHAGILEPLSLGGCSAKNYLPERDIWSLLKP